MQQKDWGYSLKYQYQTCMIQNDEITWMKCTTSASCLYSERLNTMYLLQSKVTVVCCDMPSGETWCDITLQLLLSVIYMNWVRKTQHDLEIGSIVMLLLLTHLCSSKRAGSTGCVYLHLPTTKTNNTLMENNCKFYSS